MPRETIEKIVLICSRCGWRWMRRFNHDPQICPACKRKDWDGPPKPTTLAEIYATPAKADRPT